MRPPSEPRPLAHTDPLRPKLGTDDMFRSFTFYYAGAAAYAIARLDWQRKLALEAAEAMATMYEASIRQIPIGDEVNVLSTDKPLRGHAIHNCGTSWARCVIRSS